jgi:hypothetical protein
LPNKNYRKGVAIERKAKDLLEILGYTVIRAAGSHGPWDLIAVKEGSTSPVRCIQVKSCPTLVGAKRLLAKYQRPNLPSGFQPYQHELWIWIDRKGWLHEIEKGIDNTHQVVV